MALSGLNRWKFPGFGQKARVEFERPPDFSDLYQIEDKKQTHILIVERVMAAIVEMLKSQGSGGR